MQRKGKIVGQHRYLHIDLFPDLKTEDRERLEKAAHIAQVIAAHLLEIVRRVEGRGAETVALLVRQWASAIFRYAVATLRADSDPAAALKGAVHRPKVKHHKPLSRQEVADFVEALGAYVG